MVLQSIKSVFAIMTLIVIGFCFAGKQWFGKPGTDFLSKFTVEATLPFYMFYNIYNDIGSREALLALIFKLPVTFVLILLCIGLAALTGVILRVEPGRRNTFAAAAGFPNVVFIGFPVIQALWGDGITSVGVIYYISSTILFWTIGIWLLQRDGKAKSAGNGGLFSNLRMLVSPPIVGMVLGMAAIFIGLRLPDFVLRPLSMISQVTSPLSLVFIGSVIRSMDFKTMRLGRDLFAALAMRFVIVPAACVVFLNLMPITSEMRQVFFMLSTMPAMAQMGIMARQYDSDYEFACTVITVTTIISMLTIPVFMFIMQHFAVFDTGWALL